MVPRSSRHLRVHVALKRSAVSRHHAAEARPYQGLPSAGHARGRDWNRRWVRVQFPERHLRGKPPGSPQRQPSRLCPPGFGRHPCPLHHSICLCARGAGCRCLGRPGGPSRSLSEKSAAVDAEGLLRPEAAQNNSYSSPRAPGDRQIRNRRRVCSRGVSGGGREAHEKENHTVSLRRFFGSSPQFTVWVCGYKKTSGSSDVSACCLKSHGPFEDACERRVHNVVKASSLKAVGFSTRGISGFHPLSAFGALANMISVLAGGLDGSE